MFIYQTTRRDQYYDEVFDLYVNRHLSSRRIAAIIPLQLFLSGRHPIGGQKAISGGQKRRILLRLDGRNGISFLLGSGSKQSYFFMTFHLPP